MRPTVRRIICRKLPPTVTEDAFKSIDCVRRLLDGHSATVQFYAAELVGDTAAPPSATAIITLFEGSEGLFREFVQTMSAQTFQLPFKDTRVPPQIELAPVQVLPPEGPSLQRQLAAIDDDPEFMQFARDYGNSHIPATDSLMSHEEIIEDSEIDSTSVVRALNDRLSGRGGKGQGEKKGGKKNRGKRGG
jgi:hypothetical protein